MTMPIRYRPGTFIRFVSIKTFALGSTGYSVSDGMEVLFDGTTVEVGGNRFTLPTLRGAITMGWLVPEEEYNPDAEPMPNPSANIQVRSANDLGQDPMRPPSRGGMMTTVESDERVVMSRGSRAEMANRQTQQARQARGGLARSFNGGGADVGGAEFGVEVPRRFQTAARSDLKVTPDTVGQAIIAAEKVRVQPGQGLDEGEMLQRMSPEDRDQYLLEKESRKGDVMSRGVGYVPPPAQTTNLARNNQNSTQQNTSAHVRALQASNAAPQEVARIQGNHRHVESEGIRAGLSVGGGTEIADLSGTGGKPTSSTYESEGITFRNTNGPRAAYQNQPQSAPPVQAPVQTRSAPEGDDGASRIDKDGTATMRRKIAKALCVDFPDTYDFGDHWKRRVAMIRLHFETRFDVIHAIFAAESDDFKKVLIEEFPEAFAA